MVTEEWKVIPDFPQYEIHVNGLVRHKEDHNICRPFVNPEEPYLRVNLWKDGALHEVCVLPTVEALFHKKEEVKP